MRFATASHLVHELLEARDEKRLLRLQDQFARVSLLIVDELGYWLIEFKAGKRGTLVSRVPYDQVRLGVSLTSILRTDA